MVVGTTSIAFRIPMQGCGFNVIGLRPLLFAERHHEQPPLEHCADSHKYRPPSPRINYDKFRVHLHSSLLRPSKIGITVSVFHHRHLFVWCSLQERPTTATGIAAATVSCCPSAATHAHLMRRAATCKSPTLGKIMLRGMHREQDRNNY
jgi:hypothetical protein